MTKADGKIDLLRTSPWFERCSGRQLAQVARMGELLTVPAGLDVHPASVRLRWVYFVLDGELERRDPGLAPTVVGRGNSFGEEVALGAEPRAGAALRALTDSRLFVLESRAFVDLLDIPGVGQQCLRTALARVPGVRSVRCSPAPAPA